MHPKCCTEWVPLHACTSHLPPALARRPRRLQGAAHALGVLAEGQSLAELPQERQQELAAEVEQRKKQLEVQRLIATQGGERQPLCGKQQQLLLAVLLAVLLLLVPAAVRLILQSCPCTLPAAPAQRP